MTYKKAIADSMKTVWIDEIELDDGTVQEGHEILPIPFKTFLESMGTIQYLLAKKYLENTPLSNGTFCMDGKEIEGAASMDSIMGGAGFHKIHALLPFGGFVEWLLKQEIPKRGKYGEPMWCEQNVLIEQYNKYISQRRVSDVS